MDEMSKVVSHEETIQEEEGENGEDDEEGERSTRVRDDSGNSSDREGDGGSPPVPSNEEIHSPPPVQKSRDRVFINVGGVRHETYNSTLKNIPDTRLSWMTEASTGAADYDPISGEFFFDRHPGVFSNVLNYYRTGKLHCPLDVCGPLFEEELGFWGIDDEQVESCCYLTYRQHRDAQETLAAFEGVEFENEYDDDEEPDLGRYGFSFTAESEPDKSWWERYQPRIWTLMEEPTSSKLAKVIAYTTLSLILLSVGIFCLESMDVFQKEKLKQLLEILEGICVVWFTLELLVRFIFCPAKCDFFKKIMNWIDFLAIVPFYVSLGFRNNDIYALMVIRLIRIFRIFKLSRHSSGLQILGHTLRASIRELLLLIFFLLIGVVLFASLIFYCEKDQPGTKFVDIPSSFWWAVVTMTTVGYGDMVPTTPYGQFVGSLCAVCGVLTIALPVPVIVNNFSLYYSHAQARLKLPKKRRKVLVAASHAIKASAAIENGMSGDSNGSADSGCGENSVAARKCSLMITDEMAEMSQRPRRPVRRESHLFNQQSSTPVNGDASMGRNSIIGGYNPMQKRRSMRPTVPTLPEVE